MYYFLTNYPKEFASFYYGGFAGDYFVVIPAGPLEGFEENSLYLNLISKQANK